MDTVTNQNRIAIAERDRKRREALDTGVSAVFQAAEILRLAFDGHRQFTVDGRFIGDVAEVLAELEFDIKLFRKPDYWPDHEFRKGHDGTIGDTNDRVEIKSTFQDKLAFVTVPEYCIGLKLSIDGGRLRHQVIFNGPGDSIRKEWGHRKHFESKQLSLPIERLRELSKTIPEECRIRPRKTGDADAFSSGLPGQSQ